MAQLICQNLSLGYDAKAILHGLNFSVEAVSLIKKIIENGTGKSISTALERRFIGNSKGVSTALAVRAPPVRPDS